ncbi:G8 domain-containing protein [Limimaricola hongkongensis]|nr:G8 domain-containing protein [Limimaricola hongkongensis]
MNQGHDHGDMLAMLDTILTPAKATHTAVKNGAWTDLNVWEGGKVPGNDADVFIPADVAVTYDSNSAVSLGTVRVDGDLKWATDRDTNMLVETIATAPGSHLEIGAAGKAVAANVNANVTFRDTPLETGNKIDHGLVAFGRVDIEGAAKESYLSLTDGAKAGATSVKVDGDLSNWKVGDTILVVGTSRMGKNGAGELRTQDEERVITAVDGNSIAFDKPLAYNHQAPQGYDFETYVGNLSRNVTLASENPDGVRGHVMLHNSDLGGKAYANSVRHAEFEDLGRTEFNGSNGADNPIGRYSLHLHQTGTGNDAAHSLLDGNAVNGGKGWGIVQHQSNAVISDNIVFDVRNAGIVSERGDEDGVWEGNLVTSIRGHDSADKAGNDGTAYENQSRIIVQQDNIAANSKIGWNLQPEDLVSASRDGMAAKMHDRDQLKFDPSPFDEAISHHEPSLEDFDGNSVIASDLGMRIFHRADSDDTDLMSVIRDFDIWGGGQAVDQGNYSSNYFYKDSVWMGDSGPALSIERKTSSVVLNNVEIVDYDTAWKSTGINHESAMIDVKLKNVGQTFDQLDLLFAADGGTAGKVKSEYRNKYGLDYDNPEPKMYDSASLKQVDKVRFIADGDADLTLSPGDNSVSIHGKTIDSLGERRFNEYVQAANYDGSGASKDFEGIDATLNGGGVLRKEFFVDEFLDIHGTIQKSDGAWVAPVVHWVTDRLTGDNHPVVIEIELEGFETSYLKGYEMPGWTPPAINNTGYLHAWEKVGDGKPGATDDEDHGGGHGHHMPGSGSGTDDGMDDGMEMPTDTGGSTEVEDPAPKPEPKPEPEPEIDDTPDLPASSGDLRELRGNASNNVLTGKTGDDLIIGKGGRDLLMGAGGDDTLRGGAGKDVLRGGDGADRIVGGGGSDRLFGEDGADRFVLDVTHKGTDQLLDFSVAGRDSIELVNVSNAFDMADVASHVRITANGSYGMLETSNGDGDFKTVAMISDGAALTVSDLMADGLLTVKGGAPVQDDTDDDPVQAPTDDVAEPAPAPAPTPAPTTGPAPTQTGSAGEERLTGGAGTDVLSGMGGVDRLFGYGGDDWLDGGAGADILVGGAGADTFYYGADDIGTGRDFILDFVSEQEDRFDLSDLLQGATAENIGDYVEVRGVHNKAYLAVDANGGGDDFKDIALLRNGGDLTLQSLLDADALIF